MSASDSTCAQDLGQLPHSQNPTNKPKAGTQNLTVWWSQVSPNFTAESQQGFEINPIFLTMKKDLAVISDFLWLKAGQVKIVVF